MLEAMSFEVTLATSAQEGLTKLTAADASDPFQLVLVDWEMPELDGLTAALIVREATSLQQRPKLILITAYGSELHEQSSRAGRLGGCSRKADQQFVAFQYYHARLHYWRFKLTPSHVLPTVNGLWILLVSVCCWLKITRSIGSLRANCCGMWESSFLQRKMAAKRWKRSQQNPSMVC